MQTRKPVSFVAAQQPEAATVFYRDILGLDLVETSPFALVFKDGENTLRVQIVADLVPTAHTVHGWEVIDVLEDIRNLISKDVEFLTFGQMDQDALGIWTTPDGNKIAWFKDPCGNTLSLTEFTAKPA